MLIRTYKLLLVALFCYNAAFCQQPDYSPKSFLTEGDTLKLVKKIKLINNQSTRFISARIEVVDVDDNEATHVKAELNLLLCLTGDFSKKFKEGKYETYIFPLPEQKPFKIWEQNYKRGKLHGNWKTFNLEGTLVSEETYENDNLQGISRYYQIDGQTLLSEVEYIDDKIIEREYSNKGTLIQERPYENGQLNGIGTRYYEDGTLLEKVEFTNGEFDGHYKYFYPNGKLWVETVYKNGKPWNVLGNYLPTGKKRPAGSLKDGTGTLIYYLESGEVNEIHKYEKGIRVK